MVRVTHFAPQQIYLQLHIYFMVNDVTITVCQDYLLSFNISQGQIQGVEKGEVHKSTKHVFTAGSTGPWPKNFGKKLVMCKLWGPYNDYDDKGNFSATRGTLMLQSPPPPSFWYYKSTTFALPQTIIKRHVQSFYFKM